MSYREVDCIAAPATFWAIGSGDIVQIVQSYKW